ncbi:MAG: cytochrome oxidase small assembly protein [Burkholderiales bacterium]
MSRNLKTALVLASIALMTFVGIIAKYWVLGGG